MVVEERLGGNKFLEGPRAHEILEGGFPGNRKGEKRRCQEERMVRKVHATWRSVLEFLVAHARPVSLSLSRARALSA